MPTWSKILALRPIGWEPLHNWRVDLAHAHDHVPAAKEIWSNSLPTILHPHALLTSCCCIQGAFSTSYFCIPSTNYAPPAVMFLVERLSASGREKVWARLVFCVSIYFKPIYELVLVQWSTCMTHHPANRNRACFLYRAYSTDYVFCGLLYLYVSVMNSQQMTHQVTKSVTAAWPLTIFFECCFPVYGVSQEKLLFSCGHFGQELPKRCN